MANEVTGPSDPHWYSYVQAPLVLDDPEAASWVDTADVLVVGFGGAGVSAALEARSQGADVLAIDRFSGGGATSVSGGVYYQATKSLKLVWEMNYQWSDNTDAILNPEKNSAWTGAFGLMLFY